MSLLYIRCCEGKLTSHKITKSRSRLEQRSKTGRTENHNIMELLKYNIACFILLLHGSP